MTSTVAKAAKGKWRAILSDPELGGVPRELLDGRHHRCPVTGEGEDRFRFSDRNGTGSFFCACSDGKGDGFDLLKCCRGWDFREAAAEIERVVGRMKEEPKREKSEEIIMRDLRAIKRSMQPSTEIVQRYLAGRGLETSPLPRALRHGILNYAVKDIAPNGLDAMIALVKNGAGEVVTFHMTYLTGGGLSRIDSNRAKVVATPRSDMRGAAARLAEPVNGVLGVGEGIESSLSAAQMFGVPTWAALNASNLENFVWPDGLRKLIVFGDSDPKYGGQAAAYKLAHRASVSKRAIPEVVVEMPPMGMDWNDVLRSRK